MSFSTPQTTCSLSTYSFTCTINVCVLGFVLGPGYPAIKETDPVWGFAVYILVRVSNSQAWWSTPVIPALREAEVGGSL